MTYAYVRGETDLSTSGRFTEIYQYYRKLCNIEHGYSKWPYTWLILGTLSIFPYLWYFKSYIIVFYRIWKVRGTSFKMIKQVGKRLVRAKYVNDKQHKNVNHIWEIQLQFSRKFLSGILHNYFSLRSHKSPLFKSVSIVETRQIDQNLWLLKEGFPKWPKNYDSSVFSVVWLYLCYFMRYIIITYIDVK